MKKNIKKKKQKSEKIITSDENKNTFTVEGRSFVKSIQKSGSIYEGLVASEKDSKFPNSAIDPPYDPKLLYAVFENSSLLLPNISAYEANIDGMGHRFASKIDLTSQDVDEIMRNAIFENSIIASDMEIMEFKSPKAIPESRVIETTEDLKVTQQIQKVKGKAFFDNCTFEKSFVHLRRQTRRDLEVTGNAYWEVIRDKKDQIRWFKRIPPDSIRITKLSKNSIKCRNFKQLSLLTTDETTLLRKVRSFVIDVEGQTRYCKELNCAEVISSRTGEYFKTKKEYEKENKKQENSLGDPGNEVIHFSLESNLNDPYGIPRWIGILPDVLGSRNASLYNYSWFEEGIMSPVVVMVSGGQLSPSSVEKLKDFIKNTKGVENSHKILLLEASSQDNANVPTIEFDKLKDNETDSKWQQYDLRNSEKAGLQFRLPAIVRGKTGTTYSRSTAESALKQADVQVFAPERKEFDYMINKHLMPSLGFNSIIFVSNGYTPSDSEKTGELIVKFVEQGILTPSEARGLAEDVFQTEFASIKGSWGDYPLVLITSGIVDIANRYSDDEIDQMDDEQKDEIKQEIQDLLKRSRQLQNKLAGQQAKTIEETKEL